MDLYIRHRDNIWINFVHNIEELRAFIEVYIPGRHLVIGDLSLFNKSMFQALLKFIEDNPEIDCYSSRDLTDPILLSRFVNIYKQPLVLDRTHSLDEFKSSSRDYAAVESLLSGYSVDQKLRAPFISLNHLELLNNI